MGFLLMLDIWIGLGLLVGWSAGRIWKQPRPFGLRGDLVLAGGLALITGLADGLALPLLGITGPIMITASIIEPLFVVFIALWVVRHIKLPQQHIDHKAEASVTLHDPKAIIWTQHLMRDFGKTHAVNGLDVSIERGEIFGLVGPDGAGKTTTLRLLAGLLNISAGTASVNGLDLQRHAEAIKPEIGYMAQQFSLYGDLSVWENLDFFADLYDVTGHARRERTDRLLEFARLTEFHDRRAANLSGGMQKKLALACTLIHEPDILLLDEPTTGVDPVSRREFWDILTELHLNGTTIVVSTPYMDEAERCQHVGLMYEGQLIVCDEPQRIQARVSGDLIELRPDDGQHAREVLANAPGVLEVQTYGDLLRVFLDSAGKRLAEIQALLRDQHIGYRDLRQTQPRMEEAFVSLIQHRES